MSNRPSLYYYHQKKTKVKDLLQNLDAQYQAHNNSSSEKINTILHERRQKLKEIRNLKDSSLEQGPFKPHKMKEIFSKSSPISANEKYLLEKYRLKLLEPARAKQSKPNLRGGSIDMTRISSFIQNDHPEVISKRFSEFIRLVEEQSGVVKRKSLEKQTLKKKNLSTPNPMKISMKLTFFKKERSNKFDFYKPPVSNISRVNSWAQRENNRLSQESSQKYRTVQVNDSWIGRTMGESSRELGIKKRSRIKKASRTTVLKSDKQTDNKTIEEICRQTHKYLDED